MANRNTGGFGLKAAMRAGNTPSIQGQSKYEIDAGETNAIFNGEPVVVDLSTSTGGYLVTAAAGTSMVGVLNGVLFTDATTSKPTFSNFYPAEFTHNGINYHSSEQLIQHQKALYCNCDVAERILSTKTAIACKQLSYTIKNYDHQAWLDVGNECCGEGLRAKFTHNPILL